MLGKRILQGLVFVLIFTTWDIFFKQLYYDWIQSFSEEAQIGFGEIALGYMIVFVSSYIISFILVKQLRLDESRVEAGYE